MKQPKTSVPARAATKADPAEIQRFQALAADWWDPAGPMAPLHRMNPARLEFISNKIKLKFKDLSKIAVLDIGCGGGLISEPMARLGCRVTGIDAAEDLVAVAKDHAKTQNLTIDYQAVLTDVLVAKKKTYDVVLALEVIEHVPDPSAFVRDVAALLKPDGLAIFSTLNRTPVSFAASIVAAEYLLRWLPAGTHDWSKFLKPSELHQLCVDAALEPMETCGLVFRPLSNDFVLSPNKLGVNYFLTARKA